MKKKEKKNLTKNNFMWNQSYTRKKNYFKFKTWQLEKKSYRMGISIFPLTINFVVIFCHFKKEQKQKQEVKKERERGKEKYLSFERNNKVSSLFIFMLQ